MTDEYAWLDHASTNRAKTTFRCLAIAALIVVAGAIIQAVR